MGAKRGDGWVLGRGLGMRRAGRNDGFELRMVEFGLKRWTVRWRLWPWNM